MITTDTRCGKCGILDVTAVLPEVGPRCSGCYAQVVQSDPKAIRRAMLEKLMFQSEQDIKGLREQ
jgi:hypothetical protein